MEFKEERSSIERESIDEAIFGVLQGKKKGFTHGYHWLEEGIWLGIDQKRLVSYDKGNVS